jgi:hypothetical protein
VGQGDHSKIHYMYLYSFLVRGLAPYDYYYITSKGICQ